MTEIEIRKFSGAKFTIADEETMQMLLALLNGDRENGCWDFQPVVSFGDSGFGWLWIGSIRDGDKAETLPDIARLLNTTVKVLSSYEVVLVKESWW